MNLKKIIVLTSLVIFSLLVIVAVVFHFEFLIAHPYFSVDFVKRELTLNSGVYYFGKTVIIPKVFSLRIESGTILSFEAGTSMIVYNSVKAEGAKDQPIIFTAQNSSQPWGVFAVLGSTNRNSFKNCVFEYGSEERINDVYVTGMLAIHSADVDIEDSVFRYTTGDDSLNVKSGQANILRSVFNNNISDGIDVDWPVRTLIADNTFLNNGGDSIDVGGGSDIVIKNNYVNKSGDKCISIGEKAEGVIVFNNLLTECLMGIAIKDASEVRVINSTLLDNKTAIGVYEKKPVFGGADAKVYNSIIWGSEIVASVDKKSSLEIGFSNVQGGYEGEGNLDIDPDLGLIMGGSKDHLGDLEVVLDKIPMGKIYNF